MYSSCLITSERECTNTKKVKVTEACSFDYILEKKRPGKKIKTEVTYLICKLEQLNRKKLIWMAVAHRSFFVVGTRYDEADAHDEPCNGANCGHGAEQRQLAVGNAGAWSGGAGNLKDAAVQREDSRSRRQRDSEVGAVERGIGTRMDAVDSRPRRRPWPNGGRGGVVTQLGGGGDISTGRFHGLFFFSLPGRSFAVANHRGCSGTVSVATRAERF
jgi:hypothetical protein